MTVYVIDDHPLMRDALTMLVHRVKPGLKIIPVQKLNVVESTVEKNGQAELFCLDLQLPDTLGISGVQVLKAKFPNVPLAVITSSSASEFEERCMEAGADAFIEKSNSPTQIIAALRTLLVSDEDAAIEDAATPSGPTKLSKRQKQLILMLDQGLSNRDIADKLEISEHTVKVHFWRLFRRLGVNSRTQALHFARTNGWLGI
ncbi:MULTISPECIES: response regulator transcription factor [unclassified Limnohabitans]|jgi:DNA-binding NarL/FixJ family response regulator|uniref:LuxR C-terminal-related transcriptional regulator n=1 Tax=unclassified Limnohabitans TaxID=2626134 RepID=UPI000A67AE4D|nr:MULTISPECIES: response regulator transcription factor [unclassified Limnohabitans]OYU13379.1 MAG: DNA-binding response regulator [Comamonadaceae bacterium PBBC1]PUE06116.1 DNA-binding response regulator [Limnohabitans sp. WS1]